METTLLVASGLRGLVGHNYSYTRVVQRELQRRGFNVPVLANRNLADDMAGIHVQPAFSLGTYDAIPGNGPWPDLRYTYLQAGIHAYELEAALRRVDSSRLRFTFCHTVADFELVGWTRYLRRRGPLPGHLLILERNTPGFRRCPRWKTLLHPFWRIRPHYLGALHRAMRGRFSLLTDSELLTDDYRAVFRHRITTCPVPIDPADLGPAALEGAGRDARAGLGLDASVRLVVGYLGDSRQVKGFALLAPIVEAVLACGPADLGFAIQCGWTEYDNAREPAGLAALLAVASRCPGRVALVRGKLTQASYAALLRAVDAVVLPYLAPAFNEGTSGVYTEAAWLGKPVVVSEGTWMAAQLAKSGGGVACRRSDVASFADGILEVARRRDDLAGLAAGYAPTWRAFHNAPNLVDIILASTAG